MFTELPQDTAVLKRYVPWSGEDIQRFLRDYPAVAGVLPLISFSTPEQRVLSASLAMRSLTADETGVVMVRLDAAPMDGLRAGARGRFGSGAGRWQYRGAAFESKVGFRTAIGSFSPRLASDLSSGRFAALGTAASAWDQFLYGPGSTWNGALIGWENRRSTVRAETFGHLDAQRAVVSGHVEVLAGDCVFFRAGALGAGPAGELPERAWMDLRGGARAGGVGLSAQAAVPIAGGVSGGYSIDARIESDSAHCRLRVDYFPSVAGAPDGQRAWRALAMLDSAYGRMVFVDLVGRAKVAGVATVQPSVQYVSTSLSHACRAQVLVSAGRVVRTDIRLVHVPDLVGSASAPQTRAGVRLSVAPGGKGTIGLESVWTYQYARGWLFGCVLQGGVRLGPVDAGLRLGVRRDNEGTVACEGAVEQELRLGSGVHGAVRVETPLDKGWIDGAIVGGAIRVGL